ncbi:mechanosensitive ion channel protein 1, mitochondrial isoform X2 [Cryptomeria japonica]|uniref:mechanosensitive ion channel protein 1, mitochondrial isoform X2 n=1 Tax=Cryptomeria japonica TaxID=3369 RepID=UPI0027DA4623|nr:mechanosensitive ion channel protein 1, mitochondrial isoform X2 [Cryptomeria japonica]
MEFLSSEAAILFFQSSPAWATIRTGVQHYQVKGTIPYYKSICLSSFGSNKTIHVCRTFSSRATDKLDGLSAEVSTASNANGSTTGDVVGDDWMDVAKSASKSVKDAVMYTGTKAKETLDEHMPVLQQWMDSSPYLKETLIPVSWTMLASILAWLVMPRVLRRMHRYTEQSSIILSMGRPSQERVTYEKSIWGALEDPVRYLITFMAFSQLGLIIAPSTVAAQYMPQIWRGAAVLSLVWFLQRWKSNVFSRFSAAEQIAGLDKEKFSALDKLSSVGLFVLGGMALAEACGVAVQSIITVGGIGGVATAFAARDILGNMLTGLAMQFSKPFSIGDSIKAGSIEGQVIEMGLTSTIMLSPDKFPVTVPNSFFSSQVIINKSRATWRGLLVKVPVKLGDFEKIPQITEDIKVMLKNNPNIFLERDTPYCFVSQLGPSFWEITISCNIKPMSKGEFFAAEQDILLESARVVKKCGAELGSTYTL